MNEVEREAIRIWMLPREQWGAELLALPKEKEILRVRWRFRLAVGMRLKMAEKMEEVGCAYAGWPERPKVEHEQEKTNAAAFHDSPQ